MKEYKVYYREEDFGVFIFQAESLDQANELLNKVKEGDLYLDELPNYYRKNKSFDSDLSDIVEITQ
jgi:hypothetical protein